MPIGISALETRARPEDPAENPCSGGALPSRPPLLPGAEVRGERAAPAAGPARLQPVAPARGVWGARGRRDAGGRQGGGTAAAASLLSKFLAVAHSLSASCGGERLALPARPAASSRRKEAGRREWGRGGGGTQRPERGRARRAPGSRRAGSPPGRRERALPPARRGRDDGTRAPAGQGWAARHLIPREVAGRGRQRPGSPRLSRARPGRPLLTQGAGEEREQCREREAAAAASERQHPGGGSCALYWGAGTGDARGAELRRCRPCRRG